MANQPTVGGSTGVWGQILNDYLSVSLDSAGFLKAVVQDLTFTGNGSDIIFPDPAGGNSNAIVWNNSTFLPQLLGNSAGNGLTMSVLSGEFTFSILRRDTTAGNQTAGNLNFEMPNSLGNAYRIGWIRGKQTDNTSGSEDGYIDIETIEAGANVERVRFGADAGGGVGIWAVTGLGSNQFLALNGSVSAGLYNNGANGFVGTITNHAFKLRQNNADVITLTAAGNITLHSYGTGSGAVTVGIADSGGAGFKLLRVPN